MCLTSKAFIIKPSPLVLLSPHSNSALHFVTKAPSFQFIRVFEVYLDKTTYGEEKINIKIIAYIEDVTCPHVDTNFIFECST